MNDVFSRHWSLDPEVTFLNHGSFGACPREVLDHQSELRARLERQPVGFFVREYYPLLDAARERLGEFLGADPEGLAFVNNATAGVNAVVNSFPLTAGDEVLVTDHEYGACRNALDLAAERAGARVVVATIPFPVGSEDEIVAAILDRCTSRTRLAMIDHITSSTALVLPIARMVRELSQRGIETLVDGAHAPGMVPLRIDEIGPAYYTGNAHKWICAPKGAAFLWAREDRRATLRPAVISHGATIPPGDRSRFRHEFDWTGTHDPTAWLSVPKAIRVMESMVPGGWAEVRRRNHDLVLEGRRLACAALDIPPPAPESMIGSMATVPLPDGEPGRPSPLYVDPMQERLWQEHRIEVPIGPWPAPPRRVLRISAQLYNHITDFEKLVRCLMEALGNTVHPSA
ncbi:MAG: aminotransferase [Planctomycetes bacterium]|nr:aminotransferase [Planctomycetota bacterium]